MAGRQRERGGTTNATRTTTNGDEIALTPEGYERLRHEYDTLVQVRLPQATERLHDTGAMVGDAAEAGELLDARAELDLLEERIALLEQRLRSAHVLSGAPRGSSAVSLGSHVTVEDVDEASREEYLLVSSAESNPLEGRVSTDSPVGRALQGRRRAPGGGSGSSSLVETRRRPAASA